MLSLKKVLIEFLTSNFVDWYNVFNNWTAIWEKSYPWFLSEITCLNTPWIVLHSVQLWGSTKYKYPQKRLLEIARGWGVSKTNIFKGKYEPELEFLERGWRWVQDKKPSMWRSQIFSGNTHYIFCDAHLTCSSILGSHFSIKFSLQLSLPLFLHFLLFLLCFPFLCFLSFLNLFILQPCLWKIHHKESGCAKGL